MTVLDSVQRAIALRSSFPEAHPLELLDLVFEGHHLTASECSVFAELGVINPQTLAFFASAFYRGMSEQEWLAWQQPTADPQLQAVVKVLWLELIVPTFTERYTSHYRPPSHQQPGTRFRRIVSL